MKFKPTFKKVSKHLMAPLLLTTFLLDSTIFTKNLFANEKISAADENSLSLYQGMGISYVCYASRKEIDLDFTKALSVAASTFVTVVQSKHGGLIIEKGKEVKVDPKLLYNNSSFRILAGAINICPNNVPKKTKKEFDKELKRIQKLNKK